jgi:hypothetical protein
VIQLLKFSDLPYRAIAHDAGCSVTFVANVANGLVPDWFLNHMRDRREELISVSIHCPYCAARFPMWGLERGKRVAHNLSLMLYHRDQQDADRGDSHVNGLADAV